MAADPPTELDPLQRLARFTYLRLKARWSELAMLRPYPDSAAYAQAEQDALNIIWEALRAAGDARPQPAWQPIATAPLQDEVFFWVVPKAPEEAFVDSSGRGIFSTHAPHLHRGRWQSWSSLSKATHWMPVPAPPVSGVAGADPARSAEEPS